MLDKNNIYIKHPESAEEWEAYHEIRRINLFEPQKMLYDRNHPSLTDPSNHHYLFFKEREILGTLQIQELYKNACALRTVCIIDPFKNQGYGSILLKLAENKIKELGSSIIHLHANKRALTFYTKSGYREMDFPEDIPLHCDCIDMGKIL